MLGRKKKSRRNQGKRNKSGGWVGKHRILVKIYKKPESEFLVVNLKTRMIEMKHPGAVWSDNYFASTVVLHNDGTALSVLNVSIHEFQSPCISTLTVDQQQDYIHSSDSNTCISTLDLTKTPPKWSNWTPAPKMILKRDFPHWAALGNKIFAFDRIRYPEHPEVYEIGSDNWKEITIPFLRDMRDNDGKPAWISTRVISDPNKDRLIVYMSLKDSIYAYHPNEAKWEFLHENVGRTSNFKGCPIANEVVDDIIYFFFPPYYISAYDILTNKWLEVDLLFEFDICEWCFREFATLVYLGNDILCLADSYRDSPDTVIQFLRFSVKRVKQNVQLTFVSFHPIVIDGVYCLTDTFIPF